MIDLEPLSESIYGQNQHIPVTDQFSCMCISAGSPPLESRAAWAAVADLQVRHLNRGFHEANAAVRENVIWQFGFVAPVDLFFVVVFLR